MYSIAWTPSGDVNAAFFPDLSTIDPPFWKRNWEYWNVSGRTCIWYLSGLPSPFESSDMALETSTSSSHVVGTLSPLASRMSFL